MVQNLINSREDLDAVIGTSKHLAFMQFLKGSMTRKQDVQVYPTGYGQEGYAGESLAPIWQDIEDLTTISKFGFVKSDFDKIAALP